MGRGRWWEWGGERWLPGACWWENAALLRGEAAGGARRWEGQGEPAGGRRRDCIARGRGLRRDGAPMVFGQDRCVRDPAVGAAAQRALALALALERHAGGDGSPPLIVRRVLESQPTPRGIRRAARGRRRV